MAEEKKIKLSHEDSYYGVLSELFETDGALDKYAKVRFTRYEMGLWYDRKYPLDVVASQSKAYFSKRFLGGKPIYHSSGEEIDKGMEALRYATEPNTVGAGCYERCRRLFEYLNRKASELGLHQVYSIGILMDFFTFSGIRKEEKEPIYGFEILIPEDRDFRKAFKTELRKVIKKAKPGDKPKSFYDILDRIESVEEGTNATKALFAERNRDDEAAKKLLYTFARAVREQKAKAEAKKKERKAKKES